MGSKCKSVQFYISPGRFWLSVVFIANELLVEKNIFYKYWLLCYRFTRLCSKENFGEPFGLPSILARVPRPLKLVARVHLMRKYFFMHTNLTGLLITKLGNFSFWVRQKPACCLMKPIKVFVPFRFKTRNVSNAAKLFRS